MPDTVRALSEQQPAPDSGLNGFLGDPMYSRSLAEFQRVAGLKAKVVPAVLPVVPEARMNCGCEEIDFCRRLAAHAGSACPACRHLHSELNRRMETKLKPHHVCCPFGICQCAVPVVVLGRHLATILGGKVRLGPCRPHLWAGTVRSFQRLGLNGDLRSLRKAYLAIPVMGAAKLRAALRLLDQLAQLFAASLAQNPIPACLTKPSLVCQVGQFVRQRLGERLTTRQAAGALHLSEAYFCRRFRRLSGMTFHGYVKQLRVEQAKVALRGTDARIDEIALALGFKSASVFDRVFKAIVGKTPSAFRGKGGGSDLTSRSRSN